MAMYEAKKEEKEEERQRSQSKYLFSNRSVSIYSINENGNNQLSNEERKLVIMIMKIMSIENG